MIILLSLLRENFGKVSGAVNPRKTTVALIIITVVVIAMGGTIRIYDAGESCPDWPTCFGTFGFDISEEEQGEWWEENPEEADSRGSGHRYTSFQIFTEWIHRLLAGAVLGPLVILNWIAIRLDKESSSKSKKAALTSLILIIWQGAVGWLTVELDNEHWSVALHLGSALAFTLCLVWLWMELCKDDGEMPSWMEFDPILSKKWSPILGWLSIGTLITLFSGAFVSTTPGANYGCGIGGLGESWPLCNGELFPSIEDWEMQSQVVHRWLVGAIGLIMTYTSYMIWKDCEAGQSGVMLKNWIFAATLIYVANIAMGALYILSWDPDGFFEFLSLAHLMMAAATFTTLATAWLGLSVIAMRDGSN